MSSGAIAIGCEYLGIKKTGLKVDKSQAVASIGQIELMDFYKNIFNKSKIKISQILLTWDDTEQRRRSLNERRKINIKYSHDNFFIFMVYSFIYIWITCISNFIISKSS